MELQRTELQVIGYLDQTIMLHLTDEGDLLIGDYDLFTAIFDRNRYSHITRMEAMTPDAHIEHAGKTVKFYSAQKYEQYFLGEYKLQVSTYVKSINTDKRNYDNYVRFIDKDNGINVIVEKAMNRYGDRIDEERHNYRVPSIAHLKDAEKAIQENGIPDAEEEVEEIVEEQTSTEIKERPQVRPLSMPMKRSGKVGSSMRDALVSPDIFLWSSVLLILCLIPFTYMAILEYIALSGEGWRMYMSYAMAAGLAISIDWSILVFTLNGKERLAGIGSFFQIMLVSVHFDLIQDMAGETVESYLTRASIVIYSAILINQYSKLGNNAN